MDKSETSNKRQGRPTANGNPMESKSFRSLICDESGIIIGEMVYRCLICSFINESMEKVRAHYQTEHVDIEDISNGEFSYVNNQNCPSPANESMKDEAAKQPADEPDLEGDPEDQISTGVNDSGSSGNKSRSGYITCHVCSCTRSYSYVQRRNGQYKCSACYRHFREFILKPKVNACPNLDQGNKEESDNELTTIKPINSDIQVSEGSESPLKGSIVSDSISHQAKSSDNNSISINDNNIANNDPNNNNNLTEKHNLHNKLVTKSQKRKRNWSCMKCINCLKQECGKCIYCLDRPKYGGKFRLRQRCANRRCLLKLQEL